MLQEGHEAGAKRKRNERVREKYERNKKMREIKSRLGNKKREQEKEERTGV